MARASDSLHLHALNQDDQSTSDRRNDSGCDIEEAVVDGDEDGDDANMMVVDVGCRMTGTDRDFAGEAVQALVARPAAQDEAPVSSSGPPEASMIVLVKKSGGQCLCHNRHQATEKTQQHR